MLPPLEDAELAYQTACLRPLARDGKPVLGLVPGWERVLIATGGGRKGILLGPAMGRITADLILTGASSVALDAFDPGRFASREPAAGPA
jgi:glycine oxidase